MKTRMKIQYVRKPKQPLIDKEMSDVLGAVCIMGAWVFLCIILWSIFGG